MEIDSPENMMRHIRFLKNEVERLKKQLRAAQLQRMWPPLPSPHHVSPHALPRDSGSP